MTLNRKKKIPSWEMKRISSEEFVKKDKNPVLIVLDNIRSMHNVGAVFRIADAFLIEKVILCGITATPPKKEISKTALGAEDHVLWEYFGDSFEALKNLRDDNYTLIAVEQVYGAINLEDFYVDINKKYALIFGNEVDGVNDDILNICDNFCEIKQKGVKHSLNVSVCVGIVCWKFCL